jgi:predicted PurR-regulated permease PerM
MKARERSLGWFLKRWLGRKSFRNWLVVLALYGVLSVAVICTLLVADTVRDIKELEGSITTYQGIVASYQNTVKILEAGK